MPGGVVPGAGAQFPAYRVDSPDLVDELHQIAALGRRAVEAQHQHAAFTAPGLAWTAED